jgi:hypothetical protein
MKRSKKNQITIVVMLLMGLMLFSKVSYSREFRIQYVSQQDESYLYDLNKVKMKQAYILPNGSKLFFTGVSYTCYAKAQKELDRMIARGFKAAKIRTFFGHKISANNYKVSNCTCQ